MVELALSDQGYDGLIEGNFATEADVKNFVMTDPALNRWFLLYPEVRAKPLFTHPCKEWITESGDMKRYRFDVLLLPGKELFEVYGWKLGAIALELKKSGVKVGPAYSQALDYVNSATVDLERGGVCVVPSYGLVFNAPFVGGPLASIQTQNRIGAFKKFPSGLWQFRSGQTDICTFNAEFFDIGHQNAGKKSGSR